jgi:hypothetical protein
MEIEKPKFRFRNCHCEGTEINLALCDEIAMHLAGARNDRMGKGYRFLKRVLEESNLLTLT